MAELTDEQKQTIRSALRAQQVRLEKDLKSDQIALAPLAFVIATEDEVQRIKRLLEVL